MSGLILWNLFYSSAKSSVHTVCLEFQEGMEGIVLYTPPPPLQMRLGGDVSKMGVQMNFCDGGLTIQTQPYKALMTKRRGVEAREVQHPHAFSVKICNFCHHAVNSRKAKKGIWKSSVLGVSVCSFLGLLQWPLGLRLPITVGGPSSYRTPRFPLWYDFAGHPLFSESERCPQNGRPIFIQCGCWRELCSPYEVARPQPSNG